MEPNMKLLYRYRDFNNRKQHGVVIFANPYQLTEATVLAHIKSASVDGFQFAAQEWNLPDLHFNDWDETTDHALHEFDDITRTGEAPTTPLSLTQFLDLIRQRREQCA
jgi:hypothetical protein